MISNENQSLNQDDNELFSISRMNSIESDIDALVSMGLDYDNVNNFSNSFVILPICSEIDWSAD